MSIWSLLSGDETSIVNEGLVCYLDQLGALGRCQYFVGFLIIFLICWLLQACLCSRLRCERWQAIARLAGLGFLMLLAIGIILFEGLSGFSIWQIMTLGESAPRDLVMSNLPMICALAVSLGALSLFALLINAASSGRLVSKQSSVYLLRCFQWVILILGAFFSLFVGVIELSVWDVFSLDPYQIDVLMFSRLPRLISILVAGSSFAMAGLIMQCITCNRFVSPTTAGTMDWCRLGLVMVMLCVPDASPMMRIFIAFVITLIGTSLFLTLINKIPHRNIVIVPLVGMMLGAAVSAVATFFAYQYDIGQNVSSWLQSSFALVTQDETSLLYLSIPFMILAYFYSDKFTIAGMGRGIAVTLGLNHDSIVRVGLMIIAIITSISIVTIGSIPFIGLIVPNLVSMVRGDSVKNTLFDTVWLGAMLVLSCDVASRLIFAPAEIPIGIILSVIGSVIFLLMLLNKKSYA
ncbi:MAG: iron chelate uptake ABC transporter family permease subunit [Akkermansia sp.]